MASLPPSDHFPISQPVTRMSAPRILPRAVFLLFCLSLTALTSAVQADERDDFFEAKIRPVLVGTCFRCHGDAKTSRVVGRRIDEIGLPEGATIAAIIRNNDVIIAHHDTLIEAEDHLILFALNKRIIPKVEKLLQVGFGFF